MSANTILADINEIMLGFYLNNQKSFDTEADKQLKMREKQATRDDILAQSEKAKVMANEVMKWAASNGYKGKVKKVYWTARPGVLSAAVGKDVDSKKNPSDILLEFEGKKFLGVSAKSTKGKGDIGFKNPGMGTIEKDLKINLKAIVAKGETDAIKKFKLPQSASARKSAIRANAAVQAQTQALGSKVLEQIRDALMKKLSSMNQNDLRKYILNGWMDANENLFPPYIKVTGMGNKSPFTAKVDDPLNNEKLSALRTGQIKLEKVGNESIGVSAGSKKLLKMRAKFESEKLASPIKFSGDPW
jgi:hypothetical protein